MSDPVFIITIAIILVGPLASVYLAILVMKNCDDNLHVAFETRRMFFAAAVLVGIGFIFFEAMLLHYYGMTDGKRSAEIFDTCKTVLPPIVTLILGYYFGSTNTNPAYEKKETPKNISSDINL